MDNNESIKDRLCEVKPQKCVAAQHSVLGQPSDTLSYDPKCPHQSSDTAIPDFLNIQCVTIPVALTNVIE